MIETPAPDMSNAQFRALTRALANGGRVRRGLGVSSATLIAMKKRGWIRPLYRITFDGDRIVCALAGGDITALGTRELALVRAQRDQATRDASRTRVGMAARVADPFAMFRAATARPKIPF